ncbi:MAG: FecR family protein [Bacteroidales bacterium]
MDQIIIRFLTNESTLQESESLLNWIEQSEENRLYFINIQKIFVAARVNAKLSREEKREAEKMWMNIIRKAEIGISPIRRERRLKRFYLGSAAAAILILMTLAINNYLGEGYFTDRSDTATVSVIKPSDPTLVLSDGSEIPISKLTAEISDAGARISKDAANGLEYEAAAVKADAAYNTIKIPTATTYMLKLSDGTKVWLNSESELTYPVTFTQKERRVILRGEAYFEVSKMADKTPFIVESGNFETQVLGTCFNVSCYADNTNQHVTLTEGSVRVGIKENQMLLAVGDQLRFNRLTGSILKEQVNTSEFTSWIDGQTWFNNTPLNELIIMIKRFYGIKVMLSHESLSSLRFSGKLTKSYDVKKIIDLISESANLKWIVEGDTIILLKP